MVKTIQPSENPDEGSLPERAVDVAVASEATSKESGCYHLLTDDGRASLCGSINEESRFAADARHTLSRTTAERLGFDLCGRCSIIADR